MAASENRANQSEPTLERAMGFERPRDVPLGMPSPEALRLATGAIRRRYVLRETMQHPQVRSECMRLAYFIQACGMGSTVATTPDASDVLSQEPLSDWRDG
jgi:hypothetical protein